MSGPQRPTRVIISKDHNKSKRIEIGYTPDKVVMKLSHKHLFEWDEPLAAATTHIQFILWPDDVRELLEALVWADSSREIAGNAQKEPSKDV